MSQVETEVVDRVAVVRLNRPERRNALSRDLALELAAAVERAGASKDVHAVVITGTGAVFCAGADRALLASADEQQLRTVYSAFHAVYDCPVPTVAAVNGPAVGAGFNLALAADVRVVSPQARFDSRFVTLAVHPGGGHLWMLDRAASQQATAAMTLLGQTVDGEAAVRRGLAWECVEAADLVERARALCGPAASAPRSVVVSTKTTWRMTQKISDLPGASEIELRAQVASMQAEAYRTALGVRP